jgi:hypothetical protein
MTKFQEEQLLRTLKAAIEHSEHMWDAERDRAYIVGYLQGYIKHTIAELEQ